MGADIITGLRELTDGGGPGVREIVESRIAPAQPGPVLCHFRVGSNGDARGKLADFATAVARSGAHFDLALFKFCYVDVRDAAGADALFCDYVRIMASLQEQIPSLHLGHVTLPLRAAPPRFNYLVNTVLLRRAHPEHACNAARERFNDKLRVEYDGAVFDLAAVEARGVNDVPRRWNQHGKSVTALAPEFTEDGGHLNAAGRRAVAQAFSAYLALQS